MLPSAVSVSTTVPVEGGGSVDGGGLGDGDGGLGEGGESVGGGGDGGGGEGDGGGGEGDSGGGGEGEGPASSDASTQSLSPSRTDESSALFGRHEEVPWMFSPLAHLNWHKLHSCASASKVHCHSSLPSSQSCSPSHTQPRSISEPSSQKVVQREGGGEGEGDGGGEVGGEGGTHLPPVVTLHVVCERGLPSVSHP